jgi:hypothetical protein
MSKQHITTAISTRCNDSETVDQWLESDPSLGKETLTDPTSFVCQATVPSCCFACRINVATVDHRRARVF